MAGYSATPLAKKLGIKPGFRVKTAGAPDHYEELLAPIPEAVVISSRFRNTVDLWHLFVTSRSELPAGLKRSLGEIPRDGMIWVSWPKKSSGVVSDMTEDAIREAAFPLGLVDIKVCAVDDTWSGLKLVIRKNLR
jgi:hypothetical protein